MARELSPAARVKRFAEEAHQALRNIARMVETPTAPPPLAPKVLREDERLIGFALGALLAAAAFLSAKLLLN